MRFVTCGSVDDGKSTLREQGITIDVAYRYFSTGRRKFIVADSPGHEQYTRNMATGASTADAAVILVDARKGVLTQTRRHAHIVSLFGVRHVVLAVNKMDLAGYAEARFRGIEAQFREFAGRIGLTAIACIPLSAGTLAPGDRVRVLPSGRESRVERIVAFGGDLPRATAGQAVTLTLADAIDVSRGDLICAADAPAEVADQFEATVLWMGEAPLLRGRNYLMKLGARTVGATVAPLKYRVDVNTLEHLAAEKLELNEIGVCELVLDQAVAFDPYAANRDTGGFILIDRITNHSVGAGMLHFALRRAHNIHRQAVDVDKPARAALNRQRPCVLWFTGISGAGKSTIANLVEATLHAAGMLDPR